MFLCSTRYGYLFLQRYAIPWNQLIYRVARSLSGSNFAIVGVNRGMLWADYIAHIQLHVPLIRIEFDPPILTGVPCEVRQLPLGRQLQVMAQKLDAAWARSTQDLQINVNMHCLSALRKIAHRLVPKLGLYPSWLTKTKASRVVHNFGFVRQPDFPDDGFDEIPDCFDKFVIFLAGTFGASRAWTPHFFSVSVQICDRLKCRGVFLGRESSNLRERLPDFVSWRGFVPLKKVLPRADAIVHHGGIGTSAIAMQYGVPQLIIPRFGCQPSTAEWLRRLGVCIVISPERYTPTYGGAQIGRLLEDGNSYQANASRFVGRCFPEDEPERICKFLEAWLRVDSRARFPRCSSAVEAQAADVGNTVSASYCKQNKELF
jgi:UDP:flavonoid glycosyltransferase YjiC (YdhE family)